MNLKSKFSWGHIIAFVALILISYGTFMGAAYSVSGKLWVAGIWVVVIDLVLLFFMIVPQFLKGASKKDAERLRPIEKTLLFISPLVFIAAMVMPFSPFAHFTSILQHKNDIETNFNSAIASANALFDKYQEYSVDRIESYNMVMREGDTSNAALTTSHQDALNLLLQPPKYQKLRADSKEWINTSCEGATIWNVFVIGNVSEIESAIIGWHDYLSNCSRKRLSTEKYVVEFDSKGEYIGACKQQLEEMKNIFGQKGWSIIAILLGLIFYGMMLLPYLLQERDSGLFVNQKAARSNDDFII